MSGVIARGFRLKLSDLVLTLCDLAKVSVASVKEYILFVDILTKHTSLNLWL